MVKNITAYRAIYGDTDQMGVVYYANYLRWFEKGRSEFLRQIGVPYSSVEERALHFPVIEVSCRYHRPARYDQEIAIETTLASLGRATLTFNYRLYRNEDELLIATGWTKHACVDAEGQVAKIPRDLESLMKAAVASSA